MVRLDAVHLSPPLPLPLRATFNAHDVTAFLIRHYGTIPYLFSSLFLLDYYSAVHPLIISSLPSFLTFRKILLVASLSL